MKRFSPVQKLSLSILSIIAIVMITMAFRTGEHITSRNALTDPGSVSRPTIIVFELAEPMKTPGPLPVLSTMADSDS